jgi:hypothetical protein
MKKTTLSGGRELEAQTIQPSRKLFASLKLDEKKGILQYKLRFRLKGTLQYCRRHKVYSPLNGITSIDAPQVLCK